jgi:exodeoxyribonuclease VII small subunit
MSKATPGPGAEPGAEPAPTPAPEEPPFEEALRELEELVGRLERGETGLEDALAAWERGEQLVRFCLGKLDTAQGRIDELGKDAAAAEPDA